MHDFGGYYKITALVFILYTIFASRYFLVISVLVYFFYSQCFQGYLDMNSKYIKLYYKGSKHIDREDTVRLENLAWAFSQLLLSVLTVGFLFSLCIQ